MRCPRCEKENPAGAQHCGYCGAPMQAGADQKQRPQREFAPTRGPEPAMSSHLPWGIGLGLIALLAIGAVAFSVMRGNVTKPTPTPAVAVVTVIRTVLVPAATQAAITQQPSATKTPSPSPTSPPSPTPSLPADTPAESVLDVGQTWHQGGMDLNLARVDVQTDGMKFTFRLTNRRSGTVLVHFTAGDFLSITDNTGRRITLEDPGTEFDFTLQPGQGVSIPQDRPYSSGGDFWAPAKMTSPNVSTVTFTATALSSIQNARWHVSVNH